MASGQLRILAGVRRLPHRSEGERVVGHLRRMGCDVATFEDGQEVAKGSFDTVLFLGNPVWYPELLRHVRDLPNDARPLVAVWHWEPLPPARASGLPMPVLGLREWTKKLLRDRRVNDVYSNSDCLRRLHREGCLDVLLTSTPGRVEYLAELGISAGLAPLGYDPEHGEDRGLERDLPVLFLGEQRVLRRRRAVAWLKRRGVPLQTAGDWMDPDLWGEERTKLLNRTRIFLNIQRFTGEFSGLRLILGMANGCLVISEPMHRHEPFIDGAHFVSSPLADMPLLIDHYLNNENERAEIATRGRQFVMQQLSLEKSVARLLDAIHAKLPSEFSRLCNKHP